MRDPPSDCAAMVIGRALWRQRGALTLRRAAAGFVIDSARPPNFDRPWAPQRRRADAASLARRADTAPAASRSTPRDATPTPDDLQAGD